MISNILLRSGLTRLALCSLASVIATDLHAFPFDTTLDDLPSSITLQGMDSRTEGTVVTYNIPTSDWPNLLSLRVRGGDGGRAKATADVGSANGGGGAFVSADFFIGLDDNPNYLRPGGELRFIVGNKGQDRTRSEASAAGGGGGSAVLYLAPTEGAEWEILVVAGGGGGAAAGTSATDTFNQSGRDGSTTEDGTDGRGQGGDNGRAGGQDGDAGVSVDGGLGGGGGSYRSNSVSSDGTWWVTSGSAGNTEGARGGEAADRGAWGGFGFGSGGGGYVNSGSNAYTARGGGGGGYSGGGAGGNNNEGDGAGGGGGSYVNPIRSGSSITSRDSDGLNGEITISTFKLFSDDGIPGPTISLNGASALTIDRQAGETYTEFGATATDYYGNSITVAEPGFSSSTPGEYDLPYLAVDQFGKLAFVTRAVTILGSKPTFSIAGNVTVNEDSGAFAVNEHASNFNANDTGQFLISYEVSNNNNSLFSTQPAINTAGRLSFTPAANASGSATVSVVAIDDLSDSTRGRSNPLTFTITVNSVDDPPVISTNSTATIAENSETSIVIDATEPFGAPISYSISGGNDASQFELTGASLRFKSTPDFEAPTDHDQNNIYHVEITVTGSDGSASLSLTMTVTEVNEAPFGISITSDKIDENETVVGILSATDPEGADLVFSVFDGPDASFFEIINGNTLAFKTAPDFESPQDSNTNNYYTANFVVSDGTLISEEKRISVLVRNDTSVPTDITITNVEVPENFATVGTVGADDPAGGLLSFSLSASADQEKFQIDSQSGELSFISTQNYENPEDENRDNVYEVSVEVTGLEGSATASFQITVNNVDDGTIVDFRELFGLTQDGSDDNADWSGNGIANIFYYAFGLGDPNSIEVDRTRLPQASGNGEEMTFSFLRPIQIHELLLEAVISEDLSTWETLASLPTAKFPISVSSEEVNDTHERVTYTLPVTANDCFLSVRSTNLTQEF